MNLYFYSKLLTYKKLGQNSSRKHLASNLFQCSINYLFFLIKDVKVRYFCQINEYNYMSVFSHMEHLLIILYRNAFPSY